MEERTARVAERRLTNTIKEMSVASVARATHPCSATFRGLKLHGYLLDIATRWIRSFGSNGLFPSPLEQ